MVSMAITMTDIVMVMTAFVICFVIAEIAKWYVRANCMDNPEITWIWLDEEDEPQGGCKVKSDKEERQVSLSVGLSPELQGI